MLNLEGKGEQAISSLLELIKETAEKRPAEAFDLLPSLVASTAELIKAIDR